MKKLHILCGMMLGVLGLQGQFTKYVAGLKGCAPHKYQTPVSGLGFKPGARSYGSNAFSVFGSGSYEKSNWDKFADGTQKLRMGISDGDYFKVRDGIKEMLSSTERAAIVAPGIAGEYRIQQPPREISEVLRTIASGEEKVNQILDARAKTLETQQMAAQELVEKLENERLSMSRIEMLELSKKMGQLESSITEAEKEVSTYKSIKKEIAHAMENTLDKELAKTKGFRDTISQAKKWSQLMQSSAQEPKMYSEAVMEASPYEGLD